MSNESEAHPNPHLHDADTGTEHGVPAGSTQEQSKGLPDSGRHESETAPFHPKDNSEKP